MKKVVSIFILVCFLVTGQVGTYPVYAQEFRLPAPGVRVGLSPEFNPPILKGIKVHPDNPFRFDFILDQGDSPVIPAKGVIPAQAGIHNQEQLRQEATRLIKYFLASLTIPEKDLWVNLSPYEKDRIIPNSFGLTEMGRDLLAEDYMLKQITASLIYPEGETGKKFWKLIYEKAAKKFGTTNIPVNTFNKVWIVPEKAVVYENTKAGTAYVVESKLKVMLEQDYLSLSHNVIPAKAGIQNKNDISKLGSDIIRAIVIPELTKEVNEDKNFSQLRQVYNSLILAAWYRKKIKDSILEQVYNDKNKIQGLSPTRGLVQKNLSPSRLPSELGLNAKAPQGNPQTDVELIYQRYLAAFKKGVYNYIKEEQDPISQQIMPKKYFSGGVTAMNIGQTMSTVHNIDRAQLGEKGLEEVTVNLIVPAQLVVTQSDQVMAIEVGKERIQEALKDDSKTLGLFLRVWEKYSDKIVLLIAQFIDVPGIKSIIARLDNGGIYDSSGIIGELYHASFLKEEGYDILAFGLTKRYGVNGETDILARKDGQFYFVEVKNLAGNSLLTVHDKFQKATIKKIFLTTNNGYRKLDQYANLKELASDLQHGWVIQLDFGPQLGSALTRQLIEQLRKKDKPLRMIYSISMIFPRNNPTPGKLNGIEDAIDSVIQESGRQAGIDVEVKFRHIDSAQLVIKGNDAAMLGNFEELRRWALSDKIQREVFGISEQNVDAQLHKRIDLYNKTIDKFHQLMKELNIHDMGDDIFWSIYIPLSLWLFHQKMAKRPNESYNIGFYGSLGVGKTTRTKIIAMVLGELLQKRGEQVVVWSIDDLYKTKAERERLKPKSFEGKIYRGPPGTHDVQLGVRVFQNLRHTDKDSVVEIPVFSKEADDRVGSRKVEGKVGIVIFEGWLVGTNTHINPDLIKDPYKNQVANALKEYQALNDQLDDLIVRKTHDLDTIKMMYRNQVQRQRAAVEASGKPWEGIQDDQIDPFVELFYLDIWEHGLSSPEPRFEDTSIEINTDKDRKIVSMRLGGRNHDSAMAAAQNKPLKKWEGSPAEEKVYALWRAVAGDDLIKAREILAGLKSSPGINIVYKVIEVKGREQIDPSNSFFRPKAGVDTEAASFLLKSIESQLSRFGGYMPKEVVNTLQYPIENIFQHSLARGKRGIVLAVIPSPTTYFERKTSRLLKRFRQNPYWVYVFDAGPGMQVQNVLEGKYFDYDYGRSHMTVSALRAGGMILNESIPFFAKSQRLLQNWIYVSGNEMWDQQSPVPKVKHPDFQAPEKATLFALHVTKEEINTPMAVTRKPEDQAKGGIDLTPANMNLQTQNAGEGIKFHLDPAMLAQFQNAPGFVPVIINIQPLSDLREFLGVTETSGNF